MAIFVIHNSNNCMYFIVMYSTVMLLLYMATNCLGIFAPFMFLLYNVPFSMQILPSNEIFLFWICVLIFLPFNLNFNLYTFYKMLDGKLLLRPVGRAHWGEMLAFYAFNFLLSLMKVGYIPWSVPGSSTNSSLVFTSGFHWSTRKTVNKDDWK